MIAELPQLIDHVERPQLAALDLDYRRASGALTQVALQSAKQALERGRNAGDAAQLLPALVALQARILASAARLVKPGGRIVYATCSMLVEENEAQVAAFLVAHPGFSVLPLDRVAAQVKTSDHPEFLSLTPASHGTDGFFAAAWQKKE